MVVRSERPLRDDGRVPNSGGLKIQEPSGPRWELALSLLESGEAPVRLGSIQMWRDTSGPRADGRIRITVGVGESVSEAVAREALHRAHETVDAVAATDENFANLLIDHRAHWELVHDYGMGTTLVAAEDGDGYLLWPSDGQRS